MERNEAIESLRQLYFDTNAENKAALECLIPELKESEDERIMDTIIEHFKGFSPIKVFGDFDFTSKQIIAYLEKQKEQKPELCDMGRWDEESYNNGIHHVLQNPEAYGLTKQKPAEWREEDENMLKSILDEYKSMVTEKRNWLKSLPERFNLQPKQEWSEEDEKFIKSLCNHFAAIAKDNYVGCYYVPDLINKIKSLRPQPHWKPSEEQMRYLLAVINDPNNAGAESCHLILESLYNDLKKL